MLHVHIQCELTYYVATAPEAYWGQVFFCFFSSSKFQFNLGNSNFILDNTNFNLGNINFILGNTNFILVISNFNLGNSDFNLVISNININFILGNTNFFLSNANCPYPQCLTSSCIQLMFSFGK